MPEQSKGGRYFAGLSASTVAISILVGCSAANVTENEATAIRQTEVECLREGAETRRRMRDGRKAAGLTIDLEEEEAAERLLPRLCRGEQLAADVAGYWRDPARIQDCNGERIEFRGRAVDRPPASGPV